MSGDLIDVLRGLAALAVFTGDRAKLGGLLFHAEREPSEIFRPCTGCLVEHVFRAEREAIRGSEISRRVKDPVRDVEVDGADRLAVPSRADDVERARHARDDVGLEPKELLEAGLVIRGPDLDAIQKARLVRPARERRKVWTEAKSLGFDDLLGRRDVDTFFDLRAHLRIGGEDRIVATAEKN